MPAKISLKDCWLWLRGATNLHVPLNHVYGFGLDFRVTINFIAYVILGKPSRRPTCSAEYGVSGIFGLRP